MEISKELMLQHSVPLNLCFLLVPGKCFAAERGLAAKRGENKAQRQ